MILLELRRNQGGLPIQRQMLQDLNKLAQNNGCSFVGRLVPTSGPSRKEFHDRRLTFVVDALKPKKSDRAVNGRN